MKHCYPKSLIFLLCVVFYWSPPFPHTCRWAQDNGQSAAVARITELRGSLERRSWNGFPVIAVNLTDREATDQDAVLIASLTDLERVDVSATKLTGLGLRSLAGIPSLEELYADYLDLSDDGLRSLEAATNLRALSLAGNEGLTGAGFENLRLPRLEWLNLSDCGTRHLDLRFLPVACPYLKRLWLQTDLDVQACRDIARIKTLRKLVLHTALHSDDHLAALAGLDRLQELSMSQCEISDAGLQHLAGSSDLRLLEVDETMVSGKMLAQFPRLESLCLGGPAVNDESMSRVAMLPRLRKLDLAVSDVTGVGLKNLSNCNSLAELTLEDVTLPDHGLVMLSTLESLALWGCKLEDGALDGIDRLDNLRRLELRSCGLKDSDLAIISRIPHLRELSISGCCGLTDTSVSAFLQLAHLESIETDFTGIGQEEKKMLLDTLKNLGGIKRVRSINWQTD